MSGVGAPRRRPLRWNRRGPSERLPLLFRVNVLFKLYRAGRLGWKAGRWIDKQTGRRFGKSISDRGADFLYQRLGRSRAAEDFFDRLPVRVKRWLNQL